MVARQADFVWWAGADMKGQLPMGLQLVHQTLLRRVQLQQKGQACACAKQSKMMIKQVHVDELAPTLRQ